MILDGVHLPKPIHDFNNISKFFFFANLKTKTKQEKPFTFKTPREFLLWLSGLRT